MICRGLRSEPVLRSSTAVVPRRHGGVALEVIVSWRFHGGFNVGSMGTYWENHWNHVFFL